MHATQPTSNDEQRLHLCTYDNGLVDNDRPLGGETECAGMAHDRRPGLRLGQPNRQSEQLQQDTTKLRRPAGGHSAQHHPPPTDIHVSQHRETPHTPLCPDARTSTVKFCCLSNPRFSACSPRVVAWPVRPPTACHRTVSPN